VAQSISDGRSPRDQQPERYPAPTKLQDLAHGGLKAWNCENISNATITVIQPGNWRAAARVHGPWKFNGVSAYCTTPDLGRRDNRDPPTLITCWTESCKC